MNAIYAANIFIQISNANNAVLYAILPASTVSILVTITAVLYAGIKY
jgi:hypothetical protein